MKKKHSAFQKLHHDVSLTDAEMERVVEALLNGNGGCGEESDLDRQFRRAVEWAQEVRIDASCVRLVLSGQLNLRVLNDGEIEFRLPGYSGPSEPKS